MRYLAPRFRAVVWSVAVGLIVVAFLVGGSPSSATLTSATNSAVPSMAQPLQGTAGTIGKFDPPDLFPADSPVMIHASLLPNGKIIFWGRDKVGEDINAPTIYDVTGQSKVRIWDPVTNTFDTTVVNNGTTNLFCSAHSLLPDGRLFVAGGHNHKHPNSLAGDKHTNIFDPVARTWAPPWSTTQPNGAREMDKGRWYPFNVTLETGEVAILSGTYATVPNADPDLPPSVETQKNPEIYNPQTNTLQVMTPSGQNVPNYPYLFLDPRTGDNPTTGLNRGVFIAGPRNNWYWNPRGGSGQGSWTFTALPNHVHLDGSAVMYDSEQGSILLVGGRATNFEATAIAQRITLNQDVPSWQLTAPMHYPRSRHTATLLPDGKVFVSGGVPCWSGFEHSPCHVRNPEIDSVSEYDINTARYGEMWDPAGNQGQGQWQLMAQAEKVRGYHSVALLLPDARVLIGGYGNPDGLRSPPDPYPTVAGAFLNQRRHTTGERNVEIYSPPYLFNASGVAKPRPSITSAPAAVQYSATFAIPYSGATSISRVAWIRLPSVTHGFNQDQRINVLQSQPTPGVPNQLTVTAPSDPRKCPPGHYMLFIFDQANTPSVAKIIRIGADVTSNNGALQFDGGIQIGAEGGGVATIVVNRVGGSTGTVTVNYATSNGTAIGGQDYTPVSGTLTFVNGQTSRSFTIPIIDDTLDEPNESINLTLSNPTGGATLGSPSTAFVMLFDNDEPPQGAGALQFDGGIQIGAEGGGVATIVVNRVNGSTGTVTVNYATSNGTAIGGQDYTPVSGTLTFVNGQTSRSFTIPITDDTLDEPNESINLALSNPTGGATLGSPSTAFVTVLDNDEPPSILPQHAGDFVWVEDSTPAGAVLSGTWNWTGLAGSPPPFSGTSAHQSALTAGTHQHYFDSATQTMSVKAGDRLFTYIYLDPVNPPTQVMLQWHDGTWEHRAYWAASPPSTIPWGVEGTNSRRYVGTLPATGGWVRLEVAASQVGLEGRTVHGMAFTLFNGKATWDRAGKFNPNDENIWVEDSTPAGAVLYGPWNWTGPSSSPAPFSGTAAHQSALTAGIHQHYFDSATQTMSVGVGDRLFSYIYLDPVNPPTQVMLQWNDGTWEHRAYWAASPPSAMPWGVEGTNSRRYVGTLPAVGGWVRLEVAASQVGLEGRTVHGMAYTLFNGKATWDRAGKYNPIENVWVEDSTPAGVMLYGFNEGWNWTGLAGSPAPFTGASAHQSNLVAGVHQHYFDSGTQTMSVGVGERLFTYVYLDPANPPTQVMLQWHDGTWEHRAYWAATPTTTGIPWGVEGTNSRRYMGTVPAAGAWVRLEVPASLVGLEGRTVHGMAFALLNGKATWDRAGKLP